MSSPGRNTPTYRTRLLTESNILYIGKVQKAFWGRIIQHLGFSKNPQTQGLQLYHWLRGHDAKVSFHYREFDRDLLPMLGAIEYHLAKEIHPILGTHK